MRDPFLSDIACVQRLVEEYEKYGLLIVAFDFDSTVYDYYQRGDSFDRVIAALQECKRHGFHLTVFTSCNEDRHEEIREYLKLNDIPYDYFNETPDFIPFKGRKVYYNILLDDRAGLSAALGHLESVLAHIRSIKATKNLNEIA